jgi:diguanylate cyclase (GGDEF)-like protein
MQSPTECRRRSSQLSAYADIEVELTCLIFRKLLVTVVLGCATVVGLTALMAHATVDRNLWIFTALMAGLSMLRIATVVAFYRRPATPLRQSSAAQWRKLYACITILYCLGFASETFYAFRHGDAACCLLSSMGCYALSALFGTQAGTLPWLGQFCTVAMLAAIDLGLAHYPRELAVAGILLNGVFAVVHCRGLRNRFEGLADNLRTKRKLRVLAERDSLTGLANRYHFQQSLTLACQREETFAVFLIDLDRFKQVNDTFGHVAGDLLLQQVARQLKDAVRSTDLVARLGGDEFAILQTPVAGEAAAHDLAGRITRSVAKPIVVQGEELSISASVGIHLFQPGQHDPNGILDFADDALYRVKRAGGGDLSFAAASS